MSNILWVKVKFERNLKGVEFASKISPASQAEVLKLGLDACTSCGLKAEKLEALSDNVIDNLTNCGKLEDDFVKNIKHKGYASNNETSVQINGKNHIEIIAKDLNLYNAYSNAKQVDKQLCNKLNFAYSDKYGFLNPDIRNVGSGMSISVLVMLPALTRLNAINDLPKVSDKLMFNIEPVNIESGIYLITSGASLGYGEKQICELTNSYIDKVIKCEIEMCKTIAKDELDVLDKSCRAKAIINSCMKIDANELKVLISNILVAINGGIEKEVNTNQLLELYNSTNDANISEEKLAKIIKNILIKNN